MIRYVFSIAMLISISLALAGQENNKLTIQKAIDEVLSKNPELMQQKAKLEAKSHQWRTSLGINDPELIYFKEGINSNLTPDFDEQRIAVSQSIDFPLTSYYRLKKIQQEKTAMQMEIDALKRNLIADVKKSYVHLLYAIYHQKLMQQQLKLAQDLNQAVQTRAETGAGTGMDKLKAEIQLAQAQNDIDYAERILHQARYELFNIMGLEEDEQKYSIQFMDTLRTKNKVIDQHAALEYVTKHPNYLAGLKQQQAASFAVKEAQSNYLPDLHVSLYRQNFAGGNYYNHSGFEVGLSIPLWFPFNQNGKIQMAKARQDQLQWQQTKILLDMKMQIEHAWHNYETSKNSMERFKKVIGAKSEKLQSLTLDAYKLGEIDLLNLLNTQKLYLDTRKSYLKSLKDYYLQLVKLEKYMNAEIIY